MTNQLCAAFAVANCLLASRRPPLQGPPACAQDRVRLRSVLVGVLSEVCQDFGHYAAR